MRILVVAGLFALSACGPPPTEPASADPTAVAAAPATSVAAAESTDAGDGSHTVAGRVATVTLPFRASDGMAWVSATRAADAAPFAFKGLDIRPGQGPGGSDLAVFTYEASEPGSASLEFGLVPAGKMLIGPDAMVYKGTVANRYTATVTAR